MASPPPPPPVQVLGEAVLLQGSALRSAATLLAWAIRDHRLRGLTLPPDAIALAEATLQAARDQQVRHREVAPAPVGPQWLTTAETAKRLGVGVRQAQRLAKTLDARRYRDQLRFPAEQVDDYLLMRGSHDH